ncbi:MAG: hypothetical protein ACRCS3_11995 [Paracoccaceae bacterium]
MSDAQSPEFRALPKSVDELVDANEAARLLARRHLAGQSAILLRYGDTGGRIMGRPEPGTLEFDYVRKYLGATVTSSQVAWMAEQIEASVPSADIIGLRSDLFGPLLPSDLLATPDTEVLARLAETYPIRAFEKATLRPDGARRLAETRRSMENMRLPVKALFTDAWVHFGLADNGFFSALLRLSPCLSVCTSSLSRPVLIRLSQAMRGRLRVFDCPANPVYEASWGGDHAFLWSRWNGLLDSIRPSYAGEPLLISAGIWTKVLAPRWAELGGIAIDMRSVMDCLGGLATRPAVLSTLYGDPRKVPTDLTLDNQLTRTETIEDFAV